MGLRVRSPTSRGSAIVCHCQQQTLPATNVMFLKKCARMVQRADVEGVKTELQCSILERGRQPRQKKFILWIVCQSSPVLLLVIAHAHPFLFLIDFYTFRRPGFLNYAPAHNPNFQDVLANIFPNFLLRLWYSTCSSSAVRFFPTSFPEQSSAGSFTSTGVGASARKYARETSTCISENFGQ